MSRSIIIIILLMCANNLYCSDLFNRNNYKIIDIKSDVITFKSESFMIELDKTNNKLKSLKTINIKFPNNNVSQDYPREHGLAAYISVEDRAKNDSNEVLLLSCASEGCYSYSRIADIQLKKSYVYDEKAQAINFDNRFIWVGKKDGIGIIDRRNDSIAEYLVLPCLKSDSKMHSTSNYHFITLDRIGIESINKHNNKTSLVRLEDINKGQFNIEGLPFFTNIVETEKEIFLGCRLLGDEGLNKPSDAGSLILRYEKDTDVWKIKQINRAGLFRIIKFNYYIVLFFCMVEQSEGDPHRNHGGIYSFDLNNENEELMTGSDEDMLISYKLENSKLLIRSYTENYSWETRMPELHIYEYYYDSDLNLLSSKDTLNSVGYEFNGEQKEFLNSLHLQDSLVLSENKSILKSIKPRLQLIRSDKLYYELVKEY